MGERPCPRIIVRAKAVSNRKNFVRKLIRGIPVKRNSYGEYATAQSPQIAESNHRSMGFELRNKFYVAFIRPSHSHSWVRRSIG